MKNPRGVFEKLPGSGIWWICYHDAHGRKRREKVGRKGSAMQLYRKRKTEVMEGKKLPENFRARPVTVQELADDTLEYSRSHKVSHAHDTYRMARITERFADRVADSITPQELERWLNECASDLDWKPATINRYRALLSLLYKLGIKNRKVTTNPARSVSQRQENNGRIRFLTPEEEKVLREKINTEYPDHMPEFEIALHTGMRRSEQYRLSWDCIDLKNRTVTVPQSKNGEVRHIRLNTTALAVLKALHTKCAGIGPVFVNEEGEAIITPRQWFEAAVTAVKLKNFTWHCMRHTFASRLIMRGASLRDVQDAMGHKTISMTCRYAHLAPTHQLAVVERLCENEEAERESESQAEAPDSAAAAAVQEQPSDTRTDTGIPDYADAELELMS